jgi:hypothetical protein
MKAKLVKENVNERRRGKDDEGYRYGSKKSHWDKDGFRKFDFEKSGKESYQGKVVHLLTNDYYDYLNKKNQTVEEKAVLEYIERIASWLEIEL